MFACEIYDHVSTVLTFKVMNVWVLGLNERNVKTARGRTWTHVQVGGILHPFGRKRRGRVGGP